MAGTRTRGIESITLRFQSRDGRQADVRVDPRKYDAVFFTLPAVENIMLPFYAAKGGLGAALKVRAEVTRKLRRPGVVFHQGPCRLRVLPIRWRRSSIRK
jgi:hypothetical protein